MHKKNHGRLPPALKSKLCTELTTQNYKGFRKVSIFARRVSGWSSGEVCFNKRSRSPQAHNLGAEDFERLANCGTCDPQGNAQKRKNFMENLHTEE